MPEAKTISVDESSAPGIASDKEGVDARPATKRTGPRILIVRPSALGDVCRTVAALVTLRRAFPEAQIDWLIQTNFADAVRHHPDLDRVIPFPREQFATMHYNPRVAMQALSWAKQLRAQEYDVVYDLQGLARSALITRITKAPKRVGFSRARELAWLGYNRRHKVDRNLHCVDRMLGLLEADGLTPSHNMRLHPGPEDKRWLAQWMSKNGADHYACIAPTARWDSKCWPIENFIEIVRRLLQTRVAGQRVAIVATQEELDKVKPLLDEFGRTDRVLFPRTTIGQMMALVARCSLFVGNDSAPLHVATAFDRPITAVFGPTDPALVGPYRREDSVVEPPDVERDCEKSYRNIEDQELISRVTPDAVWQNILSQLNIAEDPYVPPAPEPEPEPEPQEPGNEGAEGDEDEPGATDAAET